VLNRIDSIKLLAECNEVTSAFVGARANIQPNLIYGMPDKISSLKIASLEITLVLKRLILLFITSGLE
jgi:hypothetical protein